MPTLYVWVNGAISQKDGFLVVIFPSCLSMLCLAILLQQTERDDIFIP